MKENSLAKKMRLRPGLRTAIINAPDGYLEELRPLPPDVQLSEKLQGRFDWIQIFARTRSELDGLAPKAIRALKEEGLLWISFPKGSSKEQADLTRDKGWDSLQAADLKWVNLISVNERWSAFALRRYKEGEARQTRG